MGFGLRTQAIHQLADAGDDIDVAALVAAADIVGLADPAPFGDDIEGTGVILDIEPVANVGAIAVNRQRLAIESVEDDQRDQLFREMIGTVIVRAVRHHDRETIGARPGLGQVIGCRFRSRIGRARIVGGFFGKQAVIAERAVNLVGRNMQKAKCLLLGRIKRQPILAGAFEHGERADDVGVDKVLGAGDRAVDMAFGGEMHDSVGPEAGYRLFDRGPVTNIRLQEPVTGTVADGLHRGFGARIGQLVDVEDLIALVKDEMPDDCRSDETCSTCHHYAHLNNSPYIIADHGRGRKVEEGNRKAAVRARSGMPQ
ncbi:hypothetical protein D3C73_543600 [compost metagenome]